LLKGPEKDQEKELEKISHWFEQMDAVLREGVWVVRKERAPQGKSIFGKLQRALTVEMKQKLSNKSLFRCDVYSMSRRVQGISGVPQSAEVFHKCSGKESMVKFGEWSHPTPNELTMTFEANQLSEILGMMTEILNPKISCKLKSNPAGIIESFSCDNLMFDYDPRKNQVLRFKRFEYEKAGQHLLHLRAEILENLEPIRKIEADVPLEGVILVTETVLKGPSPTPTPRPEVAATPPPQIVERPHAAGDPMADPRTENGGTIRMVPSRSGARGGTQAPGPIPIESLGAPIVPGAPPGAGVPPENGEEGMQAPPPVVLGPDGQPIPKEQQEGEYHEGGPLPPGSDRPR
jgi:hypothetical protein